MTDQIAAERDPLFMYYRLRENDLCLNQNPTLPTSKPRQENKHAPRL